MCCIEKLSHGTRPWPAITITTKKVSACKAMWWRSAWQSHVTPGLLSKKLFGRLAWHTMHLCEQRPKHSIAFWPLSTLQVLELRHSLLSDAVRLLLICVNRYWQHHHPCSILMSSIGDYGCGSSKSMHPTMLGIHLMIRCRSLTMYRFCNRRHQ